MKAGVEGCFLSFTLYYSGSTLGVPACGGLARVCMFAFVHEYASNKDSMQQKHEYLVCCVGVHT